MLSTGSAGTDGAGRAGYEGMSRPKGAPRTVVVLDNGGGTVKLGIAGQNAPAR